MSVVALRRLHDALVYRHQGVREIAQRLMEIQVPFTQAMLDNAVERLSFSGTREDEDAEAEYIEANLVDLVGTQQPLLSRHVLIAITASDYPARNIAYEIEAITKLVSVDAQPYRSEVEPSLEGWLPQEIATIERSYHRRITDLTTRLRDVDTNLKYMMHDNIHVRMVEGPGEKPVTNRIPVLGYRFLDAWVGRDVSDRLLSLLNTMRNVVQPLPGEPPTLAGFSSHASNAIKLDLPRLVAVQPGLAPDEVALDVLDTVEPALAHAR